MSELVAIGWVSMVLLCTMMHEDASSFKITTKRSDDRVGGRQATRGRASV